MSECGPDCQCGAWGKPPETLEVVRNAKQRPICGQSQDYKTDGEGNMLSAKCDRKPGHKGSHRGRVTELSETIYWRKP